MMEEKILEELRQIRQLLSEVIGTSDLPESEKFSKAAIAEAAKEYRKLAIQRGEWVQDRDIDDIIKTAPWRPGKFLIEKFGFTNYFERSKTKYFNRKDLIALDMELKKRKINLREYAELLEDQEKFQGYLRKIKTGKRPRFKIPEELRDIDTQSYSPVSEEFVRQEINKLMEEYQKFDLSTYITLYDGKTYAMFRGEHTFERYLDPKLKKYCSEWCFRFNYANNALKRIVEIKTEKKDS